MRTQIDKSQKNKSRAAEDSIVQKNIHSKQEALVDNRPEFLQVTQRQEMMSHAVRSDSRKMSGEVMQCLAMKYGDSAPIPADALKIANAQNGTRDEDIGVQAIPGMVPEAVYDAMGDKEKVYIVAHGRAPLGDEPAILQDGHGGTLSGANVAGVINSLKTGLAHKNKSIGAVKIEACMSALSRKTEGGFFGETFVTAKPSLLADVTASLAKVYDVDSVTVEGNLGFSTGNELEEGGVGNLSPKNTEVGLLAAVLEALSAVSAEDWDLDANKALRKDGLNIVRKYSAALAVFDKNSQISQLITTKTAVLVNQYLGAKVKLVRLDGDMINITTLLGGYIRQDPA
ncbi:hypothetical protein HQQ94_18355 [Shewanella sp. VB17]|uniref:hypothetical protein n=1 Tax=Shewanella sp. VB17 TaxID=2739432 RepID=UPI0015657552|nr:hypothetical protein [Shewanella sp. VB17]NRD75145.1 hypothetical protein [Shewanella sp. VB17]